MQLTRRTFFSAISYGVGFWFLLQAKSLNLTIGVILLHLALEIRKRDR